MKIVVAKTAGFCMGVRRAVDLVLDASNLSREQIYTYGPLIHNPQVLEMLEKKKIFRLDKIPEKGDGIVLIRAHGVPPEDEKALENAGFTVINATCPRVVKVQVIIRKYAKQGYSTIIVGDQNHPEVVGLLGYAKEKGYTVTSLEQLKALPIFDKAVVVAQTTQDTAFYEQISAWCETLAPHYKIFNTICGSTEKRQEEIRKLSEVNDAVIVVGGKQSGNTRRLAQIASQTGKPAVHIEDASQIDYSELTSINSVAITAGASTPNWIINDAYRKVEDNLQQEARIKTVLFSIRDFFLKTNLMSAAGAGSLTYACSVLQGTEGDYYHAVIAMLYILSMQIVNNLFAITSDRYNHPQRARFYTNHRTVLWFLAILSGAAGLYLSLATGILSFMILFAMTLLGLSYNFKIIPLSSQKGWAASLKDIPGSKTILIPIAWGMVTCFLPALEHKLNWVPFAIVLSFATGLVFARSAFFDILAIQGDRITGKETLPILLGEKRSFDLIQIVLLFIGGMMIMTCFIDLLVKRAFLLAFIPLCMLLLIRVLKEDSFISGAHREFIVEVSLLSTGLIAAVL